MKTLLSRGTSLILALALVITCLYVPAASSGASNYASDYLNKYSGVVTREGGGTIKISFTVIGTRVLDKIGASKIVVEEKNGDDWIPVKTFNNTKYPELSTTNDYSYANYVLYDGEVGAVYRAEITVFGNTDYRTFVTSSVTA